MSEANGPGPDADKLAKQLQAAMAKRRPTTWKPVLAVLGICTLLLVLLAWSLKPRPPLPLFPLVALDAVYTPDETPLARIQLFEPADTEVALNLGGREVLFQGPEFVSAGGKTMLRLKSDARGQASAELPKNPGPAIVDFKAQNIEDSRGLRLAVPDSAQVFIWPKDARLLIVDVEETLHGKGPDPRAIAALRKAGDADWRIVYLSVAGAQAEDYRHARNWLQEQGFPVGPVLGRPQYPSPGSAEQVRDDLLRSLNDRFTGTKCFVIKSSQPAALGAELRLRTIVIGDAQAPAAVVRVPSWTEVFEQLK